MKFNLIGQLLFSTSLLFSHPYPRLGWDQWGGAVDEWYARFDVLQIQIFNTSWAKRIKALKPDIVLLPTTDFNSGPDPGVNEWHTRRADGSHIPLYFDWDFFMDMSVLCPPAPSKNNLPYYTYLPDYLVNQAIDLSVFDGVATDGFYDSPSENSKVAGDIDLDRNGSNDYLEHPPGWTEEQWLAGTNAICTRLRSLMAANKYFLVNNWGWGVNHHAEVNGWLLEHAHEDDTRYNINTYMSHMQTLRQPHTILFDGRAALPTSVKWMRYQLSFVALGDGYYSFSDRPAGDGFFYNEHHFNKFFDEFDVPLGYPTGNYQNIGTVLRVRFFDNGAVINCNGLNGTTVTDAQLAALPGYNGPYYHFLGNQDLSMNNGNYFTSIKFTSKDGVVLVRQPQVVICDIILDNEQHATTPRQSPALYTGNWTDSRSGNDFYQLSSTDWVNLFMYKYSSQGSGENTALYRALFNVEGKYKVYEWHGTLSGAASNVPVLLKHKNGYFQTTIDQTRNGGKWNLLGEFDFVKNSVDSSYVLITNKANGKVVADAFKFVSTAPIYTPPVSIAQPAERKIMQPDLKIRNYPNPFVSATRISIEGLSPEEFLMARPLLQIYDVQGVLVKEAQLPGAEFVFESKNFGAGIYWVKVALAGTVYSHKMYLVK